jgi:hypothetical protein
MEMPAYPPVKPGCIERSKEGENPFVRGYDNRLGSKIQPGVFLPRNLKN